MKTLKSIRIPDLVIILAGIVLAIAIRYSLLNFKSVDFLKYTRSWYDTIQSRGFSAFGTDFANYNLPYLYLLYLIARFLPGVPGLIATKLPSLAADFVTAWFAARIIGLKYPKTIFPLLAALAILFAPTVVLNSAFWGQADALYTAALVACIYFLMTGKNMTAMFLFGLSVSFKAQAIFLSPLLMALFLRREILWKYFLLIPLVMILALVPAWIAGRPLPDLLMIYPSQAGQYEQLSMHAPSLYSWIPDSGQFYLYFYSAGLILAATIGLFFSIFVYKSRARITHSLLLELALCSVLIMPFFLPKMHDRYFYPADVISILFAFYFPRYFPVPVLMSIISFFSYEPVLFDAEAVPIYVLALGVLFLIIILGRHAAIQLTSTEPTAETLQTQ